MTHSSWFKDEPGAKRLLPKRNVRTDKVHPEGDPDYKRCIWCGYFNKVGSTKCAFCESMQWQGE